MTTRRLAAIFTAFTLILIPPASIAEALPSRADVQKDLERLEREISNLDEDYNVARIQLAKAEQQIRDVRQRQQQAAAQLDGLKQRTSERAVAVYRTGMPGALMVLLESNSLSQFGRKMAIVSKVGDWESKMIDSLNIARSRSDQLSEDLQAEVARRRKISDALSAKKDKLEKLTTEQRTLLGRIDAEQVARRRLVAPKPVPVKQAPVIVNLPESGRARMAVETAYAQIGKPYRWGAAGPDSFDCSGLTMYSWGKAGVSLPHSSRAQYSATKRVARDALQPGDLVFFGNPIHHVGIYVGNGNMINSPESGEYVGVRSMARKDYVGAGRPGV